MSQSKFTTKLIAQTAIFMAMNIALSSFGVPVPGGHLYLNDIVICTAAILLPILPAFLVGAIGSYLGDLFFYPVPRHVSFVVHGLQAIVIAYCTIKGKDGNQKRASIIGVTLGAIIMVVGYSLGRAFIYSTPEYAMMKLPYQILQAAVGAIVSIILCYRYKLKERFEK